MKKIFKGKNKDDKKLDSSDANQTPADKLKKGI